MAKITESVIWTLTVSMGFLASGSERWITRYLLSVLNTSFKHIIQNYFCLYFSFGGFLLIYRIKKRRNNNVYISKHITGIMMIFSFAIVNVECQSRRETMKLSVHVTRFYCQFCHHKISNGTTDASIGKVLKLNHWVNATHSTH